MSKSFEKVKYLHILWHPDVKFNPKFVKMINTESEYFNSKDHLFVTPHKNVYEALQEYTNVVHFGKPNQNLINKLGKYANWIFVHSLNCSRSRLIFTKKKYAQKVIWRTWGHDVRPFEYYEFSGLKKLLYKVLWKLYVNKVKNFHAIGVANDIDVCNFKNVFGDMPFVKLNYSYDPQRDELLKEFKNRKSPPDNRPYRILVGHSGSEWNRHIEAMGSISKFSKENITVCLILSYNTESAYTTKVKEAAYQFFGDKVEIIENFMPYYDYLEYLFNIDCAIFLQKHSAGLGNMSCLLYFNKLVYISPDSDFAKVCNSKSIPFLDFTTIENMNFNEFISSNNSNKIRMEFGTITSSVKKCNDLSYYLKRLDEI